MARDGGARRGLLGRLAAGLRRTSATLGGGIGAIFTGRRIDEAALEDLEELLIAGDLGAATAAELTAALARQRLGAEATAAEVRRMLADRIAAMLAPVEAPLAIEDDAAPHVILVAGVNGTGKTTTIGKLAHRFRDEGRRVMLVAGDTFRAAAVEQLTIWGERAGAPVVARPGGGDPAGLAFDALERARADGIDVLMIDTAGRLQNKAHLMAELQKIDRVLKKLDPRAPHSRLLVLDATTGQNALNQVDVFREAIAVDGLVMTKLDGTAKGGVLVALARRFGVPVVAIGIGEGIDDLRPFDARAFADALMGLENRRRAPASAAGGDSRQVGPGIAGRVAERREAVAGGRLGMVAQRPGHRGEGQGLPRDPLRREERDLQALDPRRDLGPGQVRPVDELHQADAGDGVDREQRVDLDRGAGFLLRLPAGAVLGVLAQLQEARGQGPEPGLRLDRPAAEQDAPLPGRDRTDDDLGVLVADEAARIADQARQVVALRHPAHDRAAADRIAPHGPSMTRRRRESSRPVPAGRAPHGGFCRAGICTAAPAGRATDTTM